MEHPFKTPLRLEPGGVCYQAYIVDADSELVCGVTDASPQEAQAMVACINEAVILRRQLELVRDNLKKGMGRNMQQFQARSIDEVLRGDLS